MPWMRVVVRSTEPSSSECLTQTLCALRLLAAGLLLAIIKRCVRDDVVPFGFRVEGWPKGEESMCSDSVTTTVPINRLPRSFWLAGVLMLAGLLLFVLSLPLKAQAGVPAPIEIPPSQGNLKLDGSCGTGE